MSNAQQKASSLRSFTREEFHALYPKGSGSPSSCVVIVDGDVFDVARFLPEHPGGSAILMRQHGTDATKNFRAMGHSSNAREILEQYKIGTIRTELAETTKVPVDSNAAGESENSRLLEATGAGTAEEVGTSAGPNQHVTFMKGIFKGS